MDKILIKDILVRCILGINDDERREKQDVRISITLCTDLSLPGRSDRFADTVDYRSLKKRVIALAENSRFQLVEALAESVAGVCLEDPRVFEVTVTVEKPTALRFARSVGVEITRGQKDRT